MDLNADSGESFSNWKMGDDATMMGIITSANIACGYHAGDPSVMRATTAVAVQNDVAIGAHVGYRDLYNFGRSFVDVAPTQLVNEVIYQIAALDAFAKIAGSSVRYVKPHGALYNTIVHHTDHAEAVVQAVAEYDDSLAILCLQGSEVGRIAAERGLRVVHEAFADRAYNPDGTLVSRRLAGSVLHDADQIADRVVQMATENTVVAIDGSVVQLDAQSVCVHGDNPAAVAIAGAVREGLTKAGVELRPFV